MGYTLEVTMKLRKDIDSLYIFEKRTIVVTFSKEQRYDFPSLIGCLIEKVPRFSMILHAWLLQFSIISVVTVFQGTTTSFLIVTFSEEQRHHLKFPKEQRHHFQSLHFARNNDMISQALSAAWSKKYIGFLWHFMPGCYSFPTFQLLQFSKEQRHHFPIGNLIEKLPRVSLILHARSNYSDNHN